MVQTMEKIHAGAGLDWYSYFILLDPDSSDGARVILTLGYPDMEICVHFHLFFNNQDTINMILTQALDPLYFEGG